eukprot:TRINITY_DN39473_c0_g1_i1.p1 TRINITY_DN39473_c0_g1~~TRINITY_DN39473_c0_g1_i1.p1  ORF type:complete len:524 (-),score=121.41 TRINITY_DN39473_c0_g1_i1:66-1637(-)
MSRHNVSRGSDSSPGDGSYTLYIRQRSEPALRRNSSPEAAVPSQKVSREKGKAQLPPLPDKVTTWRDEKGWHHRSSTAPYSKDVQGKRKGLPKVLAKVIGHDVPPGPRPPRPKERPRTGPDASQREQKQVELMFDKRLQMLSHIFGGTMDSVAAPRSVGTVEYSLASRSVDRSSAGGSRAGRRPSASVSPSPRRAISWDRLDELARPKVLWAEGSLPKVLGQKGASEAESRAADAGYHVPKKPKNRPLHVPSIPARLQERWDQAPPVGLAAENLKFEAMQNAPPPPAPKKSARAASNKEKQPGTAPQSPSATASTIKLPAEENLPPQSPAAAPPASTPTASQTPTLRLPPEGEETNASKSSTEHSQSSDRSPRHSSRESQGDSQRSDSAPERAEEDRVASTLAEHAEGQQEDADADEAEDNFPQTTQGYTATFESEAYEDDEEEYSDDAEEASMSKTDASLSKTERYEQPTEEAEDEEDEGEATRTAEDSGGFEATTPMNATGKESNDPAADSYGFEPDSPKA